MKKHTFLLLVLFTIFSVACDEDKLLKESPLDFLSGNNAYSTASDFDQAINELYYLTRYEFYCNQDRSAQDYLMGCDIFWNGSSGNALPNLIANYGPAGAIASAHWDKLYLLIAQANTIISRLPSSKITSEAQVLYLAKAKFFRGLAYRTLAYLYGGVPLQLEEATAPKTNYIRATREETLNQALGDVKFAAENLNYIDKVKDGEVNSAAAYHLLSELYLALNQNQEAVNAATKVINNQCGVVALMTSRFGSRKSETPGDVYWDLYRKNNQNRTSGNTEGLFVIQMELTGTTAGGTDITSIWSSPGSYLLERQVAPQTSLFEVKKDGVAYKPFTWPIGDYTGGRGIGSCVPTYHYDKEVWGGYGSTDFKNDIRNANHNFVRKYKINTTNATTHASFIAAFGSDIIDLDKFSDYKAAGWTFLTGENGQDTFPGRYLLCYSTKCTGLFDYPSALISNTATYTLQSSAGGTYTDQYMFRLAETYLLRAEAYLKVGNIASAADDINVVRNRANATPVIETDVNLDYILDERIRELGTEERRRLTLARLGSDIFYSRVTKYNPYYSFGTPFSATYTMYAIPQSAIDANKDAVLEQNPGYDK